MIIKTIKFEELMKVRGLIQVHHTSVEDKSWSLNLNEGLYKDLEARDRLLIHVAEVAGEVVGYSVEILAPSLHYQGRVDAVNDGIYIRPEVRGAGVHESLLKAVMKSLKESGVDYYSPNRKINNPCDYTMQSLGFKKKEVVWGLNLGDVRWL
jgi:L-amino acid N-acyltransferase YncA